MSKVRVKLHLKGVNELMKSPEIQAALESAGQAVAADAGTGYAVRTHLARYVAITNVYADSAAARSDNARNNTLLKAVGSVGLPTSKRGGR